MVNFGDFRNLEACGQTVNFMTKIVGKCQNKKIKCDNFLEFLPIVNYSLP